jgi:hypothetical protein
MMDRNLEWTERLGEAFLADETAVMDSVQRLRKLAKAAGKLSSTAHEVVTEQDSSIEIEPANSETVDIPVYDPSLAYGVWPYPAYPPDYFPDYMEGPVGEFGFRWLGVIVVGPLWHWNHCDWRHHRIDLDRDRFAALNHNRPPIGGSIWQHDPAHRHGVAYRDQTVRSRFPSNTVTPEVRRALHGYPPSEVAGRVPLRLAPQSAPAQRGRPATGAVPPAFESFGRGADVRTHIQRGQSSRMSVPSVPPQVRMPQMSPVRPPQAAAPHFSPGLHR